MKIRLVPSMPCCWLVHSATLPLMSKRLLAAPSVTQAASAPVATGALRPFSAPLQVMALNAQAYGK